MLTGSGVPLAALGQGTYSALLTSKGCMSWRRSGGGETKLHKGGQYTTSHRHYEERSIAALAVCCPRH